MKTMPGQIQLEPPGAGIPFLDRMISTYYYRPFVAGRSDWGSNSLKFLVASEKILREAKPLSSLELEAKRLVPPQKGLEDSSRFWSISMALEHLVIVGSGIEEIALTLLSEKELAVNVDTATVKPKGADSSGEIVEKFEDWAISSHDRIHHAFMAVDKHDSRARLRHPWFGKMNSLQWQWLLTQHQFIHLKQIREIKKQLGRELVAADDRALYEIK